ncbi:TPA: hypothetical protein ACNVDX_000272 [Citrobacter gillenii]
MSFFKALGKVASVAISFLDDAVNSGPVTISLKYMDMLNEHRPKMTYNEKNMLDDAFRLFRKYEPLNEKFKEDDYKYKQVKKVIDTNKEKMNESIHLVLASYKKISPEHYNELLINHKNISDLYRGVISFCTSSKVDSDIIFLDSIKDFQKEINEINSIISEENKNLLKLGAHKNESKQPRDMAKRDFLDAAKKLKIFGDEYLKK